MMDEMSYCLFVNFVQPMTREQYAYLAGMAHEADAYPCFASDNNNDPRQFYFSGTLEYAKDILWRLVGMDLTDEGVDKTVGRPGKVASFEISEQ